jgi:ATP-dependent DNA helicase RecQ
VSGSPSSRSTTPPPAEANDAAVAAAIERYWGFSELRPLQREAIAAALAGRDLLTVLPTGAGKSLCYQVPPLITGRLSVVVSPLIALMQDQIDGLRLAGVPAAALHSNLSARERSEIRARVADGELRLLLVAPERLLGDSFLRWLQESDVGAFAIDEAHCISQWGHDFRPEYRQLSALRERFPGVPFHAYTATATPRVQDDIVQQLRLRDPERLIGRFDRANLVYRVLPRVDRTEQIAAAIARHPGAAAIVYCIARKDTEKVAAELRARGVEAAAYHAGLDGAVRTRISADFRAERLAVVVATVAFGMGIDRGDVRLVVHAALPKSLEHYQQETGRAGRDGLPAECLLLYSAADAARWRGLAQRSAAEADVPDEVVAAQLALLSHMQRLASRVHCRHRAISEYFGQAYEADNCGACDVCLNELTPLPDAHVTAQKILSAVARCGQSFGAGHVIDVLRGRATAKVTARGHERLPTFGALAGVSAQRLANYVDQLIDAGELARSEGEFPVLQLTPGSRELMRGEREALLVEAAVAHDPPARSGRRTRGGEAAAPQLAPAERELFEVLRTLRRGIASELGVPPYVVFGDVTLEELARVRPSSAAYLLSVRGIGERKRDAFGERFLTAIAAHCREHGLALDAAPGGRPLARGTSGFVFPGRE